jgi:hypothetical protein
MARTLPCRPVAAALAAALLIVLAPAAAYAADRTPPPAPKNLRVVGFTSFSVSLAWDPVRAKDLASYIVRNSGVAATFVPKTETTFTWTLNLRPGQTYGFHVAATDTSGNWSPGSNQVTVTLPADTIAPTQPIVTVTEIGSTHVSLSWEVEENGPYIFSSVYQDGVLVTPPTAPDVGGDAVASDGETWLFWHASTDDLTPQSLLIYEIRLNGAVDHHILGDTRTILYGVPGAINTYEVIAIDESGNRSEAGTLVLDLRF